MIFLIFLILFGIIKKQGFRYWKFSILALSLQLLANYLFKAGGTLGNPSNDGLVTALVRASTNDGPQVLWVMIPAMTLGWLIPIYLIKTGYRKNITQY